MSLMFTFRALQANILSTLTLKPKVAVEDIHSKLKMLTRSHVFTLLNNLISIGVVVESTETTNDFQFDLMLSSPFDSPFDCVQRAETELITSTRKKRYFSLK